MFRKAFLIVLVITGLSAPVAAQDTEERLRVVGPVPASSQGGTSFVLDLGNRTVRSLEFCHANGMIRRMQITLSDNSTHTYGVCQRGGQIASIIGPLRTLRVAGNVVPNLGVRVTGFHATNLYKQSITIGNQGGEVAQVQLGGRLILLQVFGRAGADLDQLGFVVERR